MTPAQKRIVLILSVVIAATRLFAVAASPFDWDEAQFVMAVRDYDVVEHQPHPPGYPLFVAAAKLVHRFVASELRSLQAVVVLGAFFLFPSLFFLARELGFDFVSASCGAAIFAFLPNVLVYGGSAFSDIPAATLVFVACALLLRGRRSDAPLIMGAAVLGIAAGIRTPSLLIGLLPAVLATIARLRARSYAAVAAALFLGGAIVFASYAGAALASASIDDYLRVVEVQREWVREVDSWRNPVRGTLRGAAVLFFVNPFQHEDLLRALTAFAAISIVSAVVRRRSEVLLTLALFAPLACAAWLNFDVNAASRYAVAYLAMHALLAADGFRVLFRVRAMQIAFSAAAVIVSLVWTWPAMQLQRATAAPPVAAMAWVARHVPESAHVYVHGSFLPHARVYLPRHRVTLFDADSEVRDTANAWLVHWHPRSGARLWTYPRNALWKIVRQRNFQTSVGAAAGEVRHLGGGRFALPSIGEAGKLTLRMHVPPGERADVFIDGLLLESIAASPAQITKSWIVSGRDLEIRARNARIVELTWTPPH